MKIQYTINNYQLGAMLPKCPTNKIHAQKRMDESHTLVVFYDIDVGEKAYMDKYLGQSGKPYGPCWKNYIG